MEGNHKTLQLIAGADVKFVTTPEEEEGSLLRLELLERKLGSTPPVPDITDPRVDSALETLASAGVTGHQVCHVDGSRPTYSWKAPTELAQWMAWVEQRIDMLEGLSPQDRERALRLQLELTNLENQLESLMKTPIALKTAVEQSVDTVGCMSLELAEISHRLKEAERRTHEWGRLDVIKGYMILWLGFSFGLAIIAASSLVVAHLLGQL